MIGGVETYTVILSPDPDLGGYSASCPAMPGAASQGRTREEAIANIAEAMGAWCETAHEDGYGPLAETAELVARGVAFVLGWRADEGWDLAVETVPVRAATAVAVS